MNSMYDLYEFREVKETDECAQYYLLGVLAPLLVKFFVNINQKWCCNWGNSYKIFGKEKYEENLLFVRRMKNHCFPVTAEYTKRRNDLTPLRTWK